jgi:hypothetical protein
MSWRRVMSVASKIHIHYHAFCFSQIQLKSNKKHFVPGWELNLTHSSCLFIVRATELEIISDFPQ